MSLPRMSLHIGDYKKDTGHLSAAEHGAYFLLIMHYFSTERPPPDDDKQLSRIACMLPQEWKKARPVIQALFKDGWHHKRVEQEILEAKLRYEKRAAAGRRGGQARREHCSSIASSNATDNVHPMNEQPLTLTTSKEEVVTAALSAGARGVGESLISEEAFRLTDLVSETQRLEKEDMRRVGMPMQIQSWLNKGWDSQSILLGVVKGMMNRKEAPRSMRFFEGPIADVFAERHRPLPVSELAQYHQRETRNARTQTVSPLIAAADRLVERAHERLAEARRSDGVCD